MRGHYCPIQRSQRRRRPSIDQNWLNGSSIGVSRRLSSSSLVFQPFWVGLDSNLSLYIYLSVVTSLPPLPATAMRALVAGSIFMGWYRWAACTAVAFYGSRRIGEVLRATRGDALTAKDAAYETVGCLYVHARGPKSRARGGPHSQHACIKLPAIVGWLAGVVRQLEASEPLYPFSAVSYRSRWDVLLKKMRAPQGAAVHPGRPPGWGARRRGYA